MKNWIRGSVVWPTMIVAVCSSLIFSESVFFGDAAQAQLTVKSLPTDCVDDPELDWRCIIIARDEPGIASQLFEDNCLQPTLLSPFNIDEKGHVVNYVLVGRTIEGCKMAPDQVSMWDE